MVRGYGYEILNRGEGRNMGWILGVNSMEKFVLERCFSARLVLVCWTYCVTLALLLFCCNMLILFDRIPLFVAVYAVFVKYAVYFLFAKYITDDEHKYWKFITYSSRSLRLEKFVFSRREASRMFELLYKLP